MIKKILGISCELPISQNGAEKGEMKISIAGREIFLKTEFLSLLEPVEKLAVLGENPVFIKPDAMKSLTGPNSSNDFLLELNSRGYREEIFVPEESLIFKQ